MEKNKKTKTQKPTYQATPLDRNATHSVQCAIIGDSGTGKTTLLENLGHRTKLEELDDSIFCKFEAGVTTRSGELVKISYTECSCFDEHSRLRSLSYKNSQVIFICYSTIDRSSFENAVLQWFPEVNFVVPTIPVYIIGTKSDVRDEILATGTSSIQKVVSTQEGNDLCEQMGAIQYLETAVGNTNTLTIVLKQIGEAMLRQVESSMPDGGWKQLLLSRQTSFMSPKEKHQRHVRKRKKKESVAILEQSRTSTPIQKLTKMNFRRSALPISFDDIINQGEVEGQENISPQEITKQRILSIRNLRKKVSRFARKEKTTKRHV